MGKITDFFKSLFSTSSTVTVENSNQSKNIKKSKKNKHTIDNSEDNSININGNYNDNSTTATNYYTTNINKDLIVKARWNNLVPHKIERVKRGIDSFNVLLPIDKNFIPAELEVTYDDSSNRVNAIYILLRQNSFIKNVYLKSLNLQCDNSKVEITKSKLLFGLLDSDKSFIVTQEKFRIGTGSLTIVLGYEQNKCHYIQEFNFHVINDSSEFILQRYNEPELDIDWSNFSF